MTMPVLGVVFAVTRSRHPLIGGWCTSSTTKGRIYRRDRHHDAPFILVDKNNNRAPQKGPLLNSRPIRIGRLIALFVTTFFFLLLLLPPSACVSSSFLCYCVYWRRISAPSKLLAAALGLYTTFTFSPFNKSVRVSDLNARISFIFV